MRTPPLLLALLVTSGCSNCITLPAPGVAAQPVAAPANTAAAVTPTAATSVINGVVRYFGVPVPGAAVTARTLGTGAVLGTATAAADGTFLVVIPATVAPGTLVELVGVGQGHTLANMATVPAATVQPAKRTLLQATTAPTILDAAQTAALMVLAPRLIAAIQLGTPEAKQAALTSLAAAATALGSANNANLLSPTSFDAVVAAVFTAAGQVLQTPAAIAAVAAAIPASAVAAISAQADALATVIRNDVTNDGLQRPDASLTGPLAVGSQIVVQVFPDGTAPSTTVNTTVPTTSTDSGPSSSGGGSNHTIPSNGVVVDLSASPADGTFASGGPITGTAQ